MDASARRLRQTSRIPAREQRQAQVKREGKLSEEQYLYLTTRGRQTGLAREIEIWFTERDGRFYVIAEYATSHWVQNIRHNPEVDVRVSDKRFPARARLLSVETDPQLNSQIQEFSRQKYGWGDGLVIELVPH